MAEVREMDFANYELGELLPEAEGNGVYDLAGGLLPEMARVFDVDLGSEPDADRIGALVGTMGTGKALQENIGQVQEVLGTADDGVTIAADWLERSGVQKPLDRSLATAELPVPEDVDGIVTMGAVANWQDRTAKLLEERIEAGHKPAHVYAQAGTRRMNTPTELPNANIRRWVEAESGLTIPQPGELTAEELKEWVKAHADAFPTEAQYTKDVVAPRLRNAGYEVSVNAHDTNNGDAIAEAFAEDHPGLLELGSTVVAARVANAGIQLAGQLRAAGRQGDPIYDGDVLVNPQVYVLTDAFPVARTDEQRRDPANNQNPLTGIRQVAVTAKMLQEIVQ